MAKKTELKALAENLDYLKLSFIRHSHENIAKEAAIRRE